MATEGIDTATSESAETDSSGSGERKSANQEDLQIDKTNTRIDTLTPVTDATAVDAPTSDAERRSIGKRGVDSSSSSSSSLTHSKSDEHFLLVGISL